MDTGIDKEQTTTLSDRLQSPVTCQGCSGSSVPEPHQSQIPNCKGYCMSENRRAAQTPALPPLESLMTTTEQESGTAEMKRPGALVPPPHFTDRKDERMQGLRPPNFPAPALEDAHPRSHQLTPFLGLHIEETSPGHPLLKMSQG